MVDLRVFWVEGDLGGEPGWRTCVDQGEGEGTMKVIELHHVRGRSAELGGSCHRF